MTWFCRWPFLWSSCRWVWYFGFFGRDPLQLKIDRDASTYWQPKKQPRDVRSYFRRW